MILDVIFKLLSALYQFVIGLVPRFTFIDSLVSAKNSFIEFISSFISYTLYLFNVPVLKLAVNILLLYFGFLATEYLIKLAIKYFTNLF